MVEFDVKYGRTLLINRCGCLSTGVVVAVVLACVGFVLVLVALGVRRIRNTGRHSRRRSAAADMSAVSDDRQEMEWDNSALTITINPMDQQVVNSLYPHTCLWSGFMCNKI